MKQWLSMSHTWLEEEREEEGRGSCVSCCILLLLSGPYHKMCPERGVPLQLELMHFVALCLSLSLGFCCCCCLPPFIILTGDIHGLCFTGKRRRRAPFQSTDDEHRPKAETGSAAWMERREGSGLDGRTRAGKRRGVVRMMAKKRYVCARTYVFRR